MCTTRIFVIAEKGTGPIKHVINIDGKYLKVLLIGERVMATV